MGLLFTRIVYTTLILLVAGFGLRKVWTKKVTLWGLFEAPFEVIPVIEEEIPELRIPEPKPAMPENKTENQINTGTGSAVSVGQLGGLTVGTINMHLMQPQVEGVQISQRQVPSSRDDAPYAIEVVVQVRASVQPFAVAVITSKDIVDSKFNVVGNSVYMNVRTGYLNSNPKNSYFLSFGSPAITPTSPLVITIMCKEPFGILRVERQNP